jgi:hypothetical protein
MKRKKEKENIDSRMIFLEGNIVPPSMILLGYSESLKAP